MAEEETASSQTGRRAWFGLALTAAIGLAALLAVPIERLVPVEAPILLVRATAIIQPAILAVLAIFIGVALAPKLGLRAPYLSPTPDVLASGTTRPKHLAMVVAVAAGTGFTLFFYGIWSDVLLADLDPQAARTIADTSAPLLTRVLYGGLTEEIISRLGAMTLFVWLIGRVISPSKIPPAWVYWTGVSTAAVLFELGHLPLLFALISDPPFALVAAVIALKTVFGVAYGVLFWRAGLEMAMLAHAGTHLVAAAVLWVAGS